MFEQNNVAIAVNVLYTKKEKIYPAYLSKNNSNFEKQVTLLMIPNGEKCWAKFKRPWWHYLAVKKTISIIKRNNVLWWFLLSELSLFF